MSHQSLQPLREKKMSTMERVEPKTTRNNFMSEKTFKSNRHTQSNFILMGQNLFDSKALYSKIAQIEATQLESTVTK